MEKMVYINHCSRVNKLYNIYALQEYPVTLDRGSVVILMVGYYKSDYRSN